MEMVAAIKHVDQAWYTLSEELSSLASVSCIVRTDTCKALHAYLVHHLQTFTWVSQLGLYQTL